MRGREPLSPWSQVPAIVKVLVLLTSPRPRLTAGLHTLGTTRTGCGGPVGDVPGTRPAAPPGTANVGA